MDSTYSPNTKYSTQFFDWMRVGSLASARAIVPMLLESVPVKSVVDVGCGDGSWLSVFREMGVPDVLGIDGFEISDRQLQIPESCFMRHDLSKPLKMDRRYDVALCLEVAEHLPEQHAADFVRDLTRLAPVVVFSAAIPGQGGNGHLNEQFQDYWAKLFANQSFVPSDSIRGRVWDLPDVCVWYAQNLIIYFDPNAVRSNSILITKHNSPLSIVHPRLYEKARATDVSVRQCLQLFTVALRASAGRRIRSLQGLTSE